MTKKVLLFLLCCTLSLTASAQAFLEEAAARGVLCTHGANVTFGGGVSAYDFNRDGWDDLTIASEAGSPIYFYQNSPQGFTAVTFPGISDTHQTKQLIWLDYDNDGDPDLFASSSKGPNLLYVNDGSYNFSPLLFGKAQFYADSSIASYGAVFGDFDADGYLDVYISHYDGRTNLPNQLFMNNGAGGFTETTAGSAFSTYYQKTFCTSLIDYNRDGMPDIYTAEDRFTGNRLLSNNGAGTFVDASATSGTNVAVNGMGIAVGDYDMDGDLDLYISNTPEGNPMLRNNNDGTFTRVDSQINVSYNRVGWGVNFLDYDNDRDLDLYVSGSTDVDRVQSQLFINDGTGMFQGCPGDSLPGDSTFSFSNAIGDFNQDGYPDIVVNNKGPDSVMLWRNLRSGNNWLKIKLVGVQSNVDAIGAWVDVYAGGQHMVRYHGSAIGFVSQNSEWEMLGLGQATVVDSIRVHWPSGNEDFLGGVTVNQSVEIVEGSTLIAREDEQAGEIQIWPQPAEGVVNVRLAQSHDFTRIELVDLQGRVLKTAFPQGGARDFQLDLEGMASGIYLLRFGSESGSVVRKLRVW